AEQRAQIIQRNLDNALVASTDKSPAAVGLTYVKGAPVITLGGYYIATVDANSARVARTTPALLAEKWANNLRRALADESSTRAYVAHLSGESGEVASGSAAAAAAQEQPGRTYNKARLVYVPAGMVLPLTLTSSITTEVARAGDRVEAKVSEDVSLGDTYIPKGTLVTGHITEAKAGDKMAKSGVLGIKFNKIKTPDGTESPITARLIGEVSKGVARESDLLKGESTETKLKQAAIRGAIGAGGGALVGTAIGAIAGRSGGAVGRGALAGLAIGAGLGVAESFLLRKGKDVVLSSGQALKLQLDSPVTLATGNYVTGSL
ncbi:MAG TPA: hypothetical protein V6D08_19205, partial [Candidatus Obscuribacterales bacterium]